MKFEEIENLTRLPKVPNEFMFTIQTARNPGWGLANASPTMRALVTPA